MKKYHGVKVNSIEQLDISCLKEVIDENLLKNRSPVLIQFDTYYIPWLEKFYKKIHPTHVIMVIGKAENGYLFNDTRPFLLEPVHGEYLNWEIIEKGFSNGVIIFENVRTNYDFYDIKKEFMSIDFNMFSLMKQVAEYLKENRIAYEDLEYFDGGNGILIRAFRNIMRSRVHYQECIKYVQKKYDLLLLREVIDEFSVIIREWEVLKNLLYKSYLTGQYDNSNRIISHKIYACSDLEERAANNLLKYMALT